ncbi:ABATE domain-containing protein [Kitasatospora sp. NPDC101183]|uniref:ABATE domain-containing protein n=1 Tax=Kitasatospora sp. NPDC101183 TaxID=3364100 RepID=UPI0037FB4006
METNRHLALELASTIRHDGNGGVADDLATAEGLASWVASLDEPPVGEAVRGDAVRGEVVRGEVLAVRAALRALLARAVSPAPPSRADADRLPPVDEAVARLNAAAAGCPVVPQLEWAEGGEPVARLRPVGADGLAAALARAAIAFLSGPDVARLRACTAPRCVRYFLKEHGRQEFCKASCSNRARAARHYQRHHAAPAEG